MLNFTVRIKKKTFFLIASSCFLCGIFNAGFSQGRLGFHAGTGIIYYNGELREKNKIIPSTKVINPFFRAGINYTFSPRIESSLSFIYGNIEGADSLASDRNNVLRNQSFKSVIEELSLSFEYHLFGNGSRFFNPFISGGAGVFHFNPTAELNGIRFNLQPLGTEGQLIAKENQLYSKPYKLTQVSLPVGIGVYTRINKNWRLKIDYAIHFTFTDYIDDVSTVYPDSTSLANTPNGHTAVQLSGRRLDGTFPNAGRSRGNPNYKDNYSTLGITIIYNPSSLHKGISDHQNWRGKASDKKLNCPRF